MVHRIDFEIGILVDGNRQLVDLVGCQPCHLQAVFLEFKIDIGRLKQTTNTFIDPVARRHEIVEGFRLAVLGAVEFVTGIEHVDEVALTDEKFFAVGLDRFRSPLDMRIEKLELLNEQLVRRPGQAQGIDDLASNPGREFFLLEHRADAFLLFGFISSAAIQVVGQVQG